MNQEQWARALLSRLGYSTSNANVTAIMAWMRAEGGNWNNSAHYNPLNTTQRMSGSSSMNSVGVQSYTSWEQGLQATVTTLRNGYYGPILSALKSGKSANAVAQAVVGSPWGTKHISVSGITVTGDTGTYSSMGTGTVKPKLDKNELMEEYGLSAALINSSKELKNLFNKAVSQGWSATRFQAGLKNSKWWKTQSSSLRKYITTKFTDPATFKQNWSNAQYKVNQLAVQVGLGNQIGKGGKSSKLLKEAIYNSLALGWSDARIKDWLGARTTVHDGVMWGEAGEAFDKLHEIAYLNGMKYTTYYATASKNIVSGKSTLETEEAKIRQQAAARYSAFADQIKAGQNVMDLAAPYIKSLSTLLELPETDVDLFNKHIAHAMTAKPAAGAGAGTQMPLWQFENEVRNDPLWRKTNNARESMMTVARSVAKDFGLAW